jgi:hypothetical protein
VHAVLSPAAERRFRQLARRGERGRPALALGEQDALNDLPGDVFALEIADGLIQAQHFLVHECHFNML